MKEDERERGRDDGRELLWDLLAGLPREEHGNQRERRGHHELFDPDRDESEERLARSDVGVHDVVARGGEHRADGGGHRAGDRAHDAPRVAAREHVGERKADVSVFARRDDRADERQPQHRRAQIRRGVRDADAAEHAAERLGQRQEDDREEHGEQDRVLDAARDGRDRPGRRLFVRLFDGLRAHATSRLPSSAAPESAERSSRDTRRAQPSPCRTSRPARGRRGCEARSARRSCATHRCPARRP